MRSPEVQPAPHPAAPKSDASVATGRVRAAAARSTGRAAGDADQQTSPPPLQDGTIGPDRQPGPDDPIKPTTTSNAMSQTPKKPESVPKAMQPRFEALVGLTDRLCAEHL